MLTEGTSAFEQVNAGAPPESALGQIYRNSKDKHLRTGLLRSAYKGAQ